MAVDESISTGAPRKVDPGKQITDGIGIPMMNDYNSKCIAAVGIVLFAVAGHGNNSNNVKKHLAQIKPHL